MGLTLRERHARVWIIAIPVGLLMAAGALFFYAILSRIFP